MKNRFAVPDPVPDAATADKPAASPAPGGAAIGAGAAAGPAAAATGGPDSTATAGAAAAAPVAAFVAVGVVAAVSVGTSVWSVGDTRFFRPMRRRRAVPPVRPCDWGGRTGPVAGVVVPLVPVDWTLHAVIGIHTFTHVHSGTLTHTHTRTYACTQEARRVGESGNVACISCC